MNSNRMPEIDKIKQRLAANRERVRRHRAKVNPPRPEARPAPCTGAERTRRYKERKRQANIQSIPPSQEQDSNDQPKEPKEYPSCKRTRQYRLRQQARAGMPVN